jgi:hypothetical protein
MSEDHRSNQDPRLSESEHSRSAEHSHSSHAQNDGGHHELPKMSSSDSSNWQTVDFPNAISVDAIQRQALYIQETMQSDSSNSPKPELDTVNQLNQAELIKLIQELNQCNNGLMSRITQLEQALEQSEQALQIEIARSHEAQMTFAVESKTNATPEQVHYLLNQLEFAQQTIQRQEILIETLTSQLQTSQERVTQIEQDFALAQQRYHEQSHQLQNAEQLCHNLQIRLQRQQGYTLQFKAALEKCLEVPPPSYDAATPAPVNHPSEAIAPSAGTNLEEPVTQPFLPKVRQIRPWSVQPTSSSDAENVDKEALHSPSASAASVPSSDEPLDSVNPLPPLSTVSLFPSGDLSPAQSRFQSTLSELARTTLDVPTESEPESDPEAIALKESNAPTADKPKSLPISSSLDSNPFFKTPETATEATSAPSEFNVADAAQVDEIHESSASIPEEIVAVESDTDDLSGGDALWRDLARLVDASMDDVIRVQATQNFEAFEGLQPPHAEASSHPTDATQPHSPTTTNLAVSQSTDQEAQSFSASENSAQLPNAERGQAELAQSTQPIQLEQETPHSSTSSPNVQTSPTLAWPSPLIYPTRPLKKRSSLAAVDLPTFPRPAGQK